MMFFLGLAILIWLEMVNPNLDLLLPYQNEILELVNDQRSKGCRCGQDSIPPRPPLQWNNRIAKAAIEHAKYMHRSGLLTHTDGKGQRADVRLKKAGYNWKAFAENVGGGYDTPLDIFLAWKNSPPHCKNMMGNYDETAIVKFEDFWVQNLATSKKI
ncbi:MAG: CAP domain-containing protein [Saprospiraceae bacterium]|nr:CAP domain-containing protein [Saprospiraceae bacterium]